LLPVTQALSAELSLYETVDGFTAPSINKAEAGLLVHDLTRCAATNALLISEFSALTERLQEDRTESESGHEILSGPPGLSELPHLQWQMEPPSEQEQHKSATPFSVRTSSITLTDAPNLTSYIPTLVEEKEIPGRMHMDGIIFSSGGAKNDAALQEDIGMQIKQVLLHAEQQDNQVSCSIKKVSQD
jgi:hypothetical protein